MFTPVDWSLRTNIYEVNIRQYTPEGTFQAFSKHLERLRAMGFEVLWFMPITPISRHGRKGTLGSYYACSDYTSINPEFGTLDDFINLIHKAHGLGFKIIIDWVANHTGWDHTWTEEHPDFYLKNEVGNFYDRNGWEDVIDLNFYHRGMREEMIRSMKFWVDTCDVDGFRCDMAHLVPLDFWQEARVQLDKTKLLFWLAECDVPEYHGVFDATYTWTWMHKSELYCRKELDLHGLKQSLLQQEKRFPEGSLRCYFTTNHDENSWNGTEYEKYGGAAASLSVFSATWNGIPLIYSGQELPNKKRLLFFDKDQIDWELPLELENFYSKLLEIRKRNPALCGGEKADENWFLHTSSPENILAFLRKTTINEVVILLNLTNSECSFTIQDERVQGNYKDGFNNKEVVIIPFQSITLEPWGYRVFVKL